MRDAGRWAALAVVTVSMWALPTDAVAARLWAAPDTTIVTSPEPTIPDTTTDTTTPETSGPDDSGLDDSGLDDSTPDDSMPDDALVGAGDPDSDVDTTTAAIAVVGFVALVVLASWWMVRRSDPDAEPMPRQPPGDLL